MTSVVACEPELPPLEMIKGRNMARIAAFSISPLYPCIAVAVSISPRKRMISQVARFLTIRSSGIVVYGSSRASIPPSFWMSSVASSSATSSMSSLVTMPTSTSLESTTGSATRSYFRKALSASSWVSFTLNATKARSRKSLTFASNGRRRNSRIRRSSISLPRSSTT